MRPFLLLAGVLSTGCALAGRSGPILAPTSIEKIATLTVVRIATKGGIAHGCPVGPRDLLTAGHVMMRYGHAGPEAIPATWSDTSGHSGSLTMLYFDARRDLVLAESTDVPFARWFALASTPPAIGTRAHAVGYDFDNPSLSQRTVSVRVTGLLGGDVLFERSAGPGSSGSCWINEAGEVIAIHHGNFPRGQKKETASGSGVWPPWYPIAERWRSEEP